MRQMVITRHGEPEVLSHGFGAPAGGSVQPSRSAQISEPSDVDCRPGVMKVAGRPAIIDARSSAYGWAPRNTVPAVLKTFIDM